MDLNVQTESKNLPAHLWKPGQSGNPAGRQKGSRNKLAEFFLDALVKDFEANGTAAIEKCRAEDVSTYLKIIAAVVPKELVIERATDGLSDADLASALDFIRSQLARSRSQEAGGGTVIEGSAEQVADVPALPQAE